VDTARAAVLTSDYANATMNQRPPARHAQICRRLLQAHAFVTGAAGLVLVARPDTIPSTVGIELLPAAYLMSYLLAAAEFGFAALSWMAARSTIDHRRCVPVVPSPRRCIGIFRSAAL